MSHRDIVIEKFGPAGSNIFYSAQNRLISADNDGTNACVNGTSSLSGTVFVDKDNNGDINSNEPGIAGVKVVLTGTNDLGQFVTLTDYTDSDGFYQFTNLRDGTYKVTETQPSAQPQPPCSPASPPWSHAAARTSSAALNWTPPQPPPAPPPRSSYPAADSSPFKSPPAPSKAPAYTSRPKVTPAKTPAHQATSM